MNGNDKTDVDVATGDFWEKIDQVFDSTNDAPGQPPLSLLSSSTTTAHIVTAAEVQTHEEDDVVTPISFRLRRSTIRQGSSFDERKMTSYEHLQKSLRNLVQDEEENNNGKLEDSSSFFSFASSIDSTDNKDALYGITDTPTNVVDRRKQLTLMKQSPLSSQQQQMMHHHQSMRNLTASTGSTRNLMLKLGDSLLPEQHGPMTTRNFNTRRTVQRVRTVPNSRECLSSSSCHQIRSITTCTTSTKEPGSSSSSSSSSSSGGGGGGGNRKLMAGIPEHFGVVSSCHARIMRPVQKGRNMSYHDPLYSRSCHQFGRTTSSSSTTTTSSSNCSSNKKNAILSPSQPKNTKTSVSVLANNCHKSGTTGSRRNLLALTGDENETRMTGTPHDTFTTTITASSSSGSENTTQNVMTDLRAVNMTTMTMNNSCRRTSRRNLMAAAAAANSNNNIETIMTGNDVSSFVTGSRIRRYG